MKRKINGDVVALQFIFFFFFSFFIFCTNNSLAFWGKAEIKGVVKDCFGNPIDEVHVKIKHSKFSGITNKEGKYSIVYSPGSFTVLYTKTDYYVYQLELNLTSKDKFPIEDVILVMHPVKILNSFWKSTLEANYSEAEKFLSSVAKEQLMKQGDNWQSVMTKFTTRYRINNIKVVDNLDVDMKENEKQIHVHCKIFFYDQKKEKSRESITETKMILEDGCWKVDDPL